MSVKKGYKQSPEHVRKRAQKIRWSSYKDASIKPNEDLLKLALSGLPLPGLSQDLLPGPPAGPRKIRKDAWDA